MREARAGIDSLVDDDLQVSESLAAGGFGAAPPGVGDFRQLAVVQLGDGARVPWGVDDDLLPFEGWVEIRNDS